MVQKQNELRKPKYMLQSTKFLKRNVISINLFIVFEKLSYKSIFLNLIVSRHIIINVQIRPNINNTYTEIFCFTRYIFPK